MNSMAIWTYSLIAGAVVIVIVALLLIMLIAAAKRVDKHAALIWDAGKKIAGNTVSIWLLDVTNKVAGQILETAQSIDAKAESIDKRIAGLGEVLTARR